MRPLFVFAAAWALLSAFPEGRLYRGQGSPAPLRAEGTMAAPAWAVREVVLAPSRFEGVMPYLAEERVLSVARCAPGATALPGCKSAVVYDRFSPPVVGDREGAIRVDLLEDALAAGGVFREAFALVPGGPSRPGAVRMVADRGGWLLRADGGRTRFVYEIATDPGGLVPRWLADRANRRSVPDMIAAVERAAASLARQRAAAPQVHAEPGEGREPDHAER